MLLNNVVIADSGRVVDIRVSEGLIAQIAPSSVNNNVEDELHISFDNAIIFPGLINSHDHLDFNLFPQLGSRKYNNYSEWGAHIHKEYKTEIDEVLKVPQALRSQWGMYKNLLCGVTTVVNHGSGSNITDKLITIFDKKHDLHSVGFDKQWKLRLNNPLKKKLPVVIHTGEGTDAAAGDEIDVLIKGNKLHRKMIAVHGVAMQPKQALKFNALVWCPGSNYFLLDRTAPVNKLKLYTRVLFGTDSTLTGHWDIWEHIHLAYQTGLLTSQELYRTLTRNGAEEWGLNSGELLPGKNADLVVAKKKEGVSSLDTFFNLTPADILLVMHKGEIRLADDSIYSQIKDKLAAGYSKVKIGDCYKYVQGDMGALINSIQRYWPQAPFPVSVHGNE
jgi:cytosine/adenosine deaminase-related metal-dependent hydrolase